MGKALEDLGFDNAVLRALPLDRSGDKAQRSVAQVRANSLGARARALCWQRLVEYSGDRLSAITVMVDQP